MVLLGIVGGGQASAQEAVPGIPLVRYSIADASGKAITYYTSQPPAPAPILLMIQGSGCSLVIKSNGASNYSTMYGLLRIAAEGAFTVVVVEKPFADPAASGGGGERCSDEFRRSFTAETWLTAIETVLTEVRERGDVDTSRQIVLGVSEGAVMASLVAGSDPAITHVIAISGSGTGQLFDFLALAYQHCFDRSACLQAIEAQVRAINEDPESADKMAWGHAYRRWSSFLRVDPAEALLDSSARVYIALGTGDNSVPPLSTEVGIAKLMSHGRDITVRRIADVGHGLATENNDYSVLDAVLREVLDWAVN